MPAETSSITPPPLFMLWEQHRSKIMITLLVAMGLFFIVGVLFFWKRSERLAAESLLSSVSGVEGWQKVVHRYPHSGAAANALLLLAGAQAHNHHFEESSKTYDQFLKSFSHNPLAISAYLGKVMNEDAMGHADRAIQDLQKAVGTYPKSYAAPEALLLEARIMARLGKKEEAKRLLQMITAQYPDSLVNTIVLKQRVVSPSPQ
jgi:TolA-binding protein